MAVALLIVGCILLATSSVYLWHQTEQLEAHNFELREAVAGGFPEKFDAVSQMVHRTAISKGFWKGSEQQTPAVKLCLIHSEVSEVMEAVRQPEHLFDGNQEMEELADVVIRVMDYAVGFRAELSLGDAICDKMRTNLSRPFKHGEKQF